MKKVKLAVLGANPAYQKILLFPRFVRDAVNRAERQEIFTSGKGINFARAAKCHGKAEPVVVQFVGGKNGEYIVEKLKEEGIASLDTVTATPTRCCTTCLDLDDKSMTELIEPSFAVTAAEAEHLLADFTASLQGASGAALCGTLPTGSDPAIYLKAAKAAKAAKVPLLVDAYKEIGDLLRIGGIRLKINKMELEKLSGVSGVREGMKAIFSAFPVEMIAITDGPHKAYCSDRKILVAYELPELDQLVNPIGCGDTSGAAWMSELACGTPAAEAFRIALAAASANCRSLLPGSFDPAYAASYASAIRMSEETL